MVGLISNIMINKKFDTFLIEEQDKRFQKIRKDINNLFIEKGNNLTFDDISHYAFRENLYLEVRDTKGNVISHSGNYNRFKKNMMSMMKGHHRRMHQNFAPIGNYVEKNFSLFQQGETIGTLIIGYIDNSHLTESAMIFKGTLSSSLFLSGIMAVTLGFIISIFLSKGLTEPLIDITNTANKIRNGDLKSRSNIKSNTEEILQLSQSINYLSETLEKQESLRKRYALDIAHELRTPLTTLQSHVEAMLDEVWEPSHENLLVLMDEIQGLAKLIEGLKNTFKSLESKLNINRVKFNISAELKDIVSKFGPLFHQKDYIIESLIEENVDIFMDIDRFRQIIYNLLSNSMKYLGHNGKVVVSLADEGDYIKITIEDNGAGIDEKDIPFIFERFYRADISRNKETGGTGLGLSIVKNLVEAHNGSISVNSIKGEGTKFIIYLPTINS